MSTKRYDTAIIGGSLSARITAVLLAKNGHKVLFVRQREATAPTWFHSSLFLEKLLGVLGGRACFTAPLPIQVLSRHARLTLQNDVPIEAELNREFGEEGPAVLAFLNRLGTLGNALEELFWENGGLPWPSLKNSAGFRILCMRRKLKTSEVEAPVADHLHTFPENVRLFLADLLQGLSLMPVEQLSMGKAALLWTEANRPENLREPDFSQLLSKRLEQFHGQKADLDELQSLDNDGKRWTGGRFKEGGRFAADLFLLGDHRWQQRFTAARSKVVPVSQQLTTYQLGDLSGQLSPLLATRVICGGSRPMRLAIDTADDARPGQLMTTGETAEDEIRQQLQPVLPFAEYRLEPVAAEESLQQQEKPQKATLTNVPFQLGPNLYWADSDTLLPGLGAAGAAMVGWTLATHLASQTTNRQD